jgi:hypothetical protein
MNRNTLCTILVVVLALCFAGCSSNSPVIGRGGIRIALTTAPPEQMNEGQVAAVAATVTGDSMNGGVDWTCSTTGVVACGAANFSATHTASGVSTNFTAPAGVETVKVTATSTTDNTKSVSANVNVVSGITVTLTTPPPANMVVSTMAMVTATVTGDSMNGGVNWSCSTAGTFTCNASNFSATQTASGVPTTFTAPTGAETVTVTATSVTDMTKSASANVNVTLTPPITTNYSFYLSGQEAINSGPNFYSLAGTVSIDTNGNVTAGVQDYNDAIGITSPEPSGDTITGGMLTFQGPNGQATLTLITNNANLGVGGTETLGVQFVNPNHALVIQFDGTATSSGSMDLQTLPATISNGYAFTLSGVDTSYNPVSVGGVFSVTGTSITTGTLDINDSGSLTQQQSFTGTVNAADPTFGRGTINFNLNPQNLPGTVVYYVVNSKAIRIIDVDTGDSAIGSAFSQGAGGFNNTSLGATVFAIADNPFSGEAGAVGMFSTSNTGSMPANFMGVGEDNELANAVQSSLAAAISGTYNISAPGTPDGYGNLTITNGGFSPGNVALLGIYLTDPTLNLNDPNNTTTGLGGAVVNDLDDSLPGTTGVLTPQTDTATGSFTGAYTAGFQGYNNFTACSLCEVDMVAQGSVTAGAISFTGLVSDPFLTLSGNPTPSGNTFTSTPLADGTNMGRYSMLVPTNPFAATVNGTLYNLNVVMYQASGTQLYWLEFDNNAVFVGPLEAQVFNTAPQKGGKKAAAATKTKH